MNNKFTKFLIFPALVAGMAMFSCTEVEKIQVEHIVSVNTRTRSMATAVLWLSAGSPTGLRTGLRGAVI